MSMKQIAMQMEDHAISSSVGRCAGHPPDLALYNNDVHYAQLVSVPVTLSHVYCNHEI